MFVDQIYLLHRPAPGPSPCPLHTQQNSGRNGKKPIPWPILRSRSSSTRLWCESSAYFTLWMFIADAANPECFAPPQKVVRALGRVRLRSLIRGVTLVELRMIQGWSSRLFRGGRRLCAGLGERGREREGERGREETKTWTHHHHQSHFKGWCRNSSSAPTLQKSFF